jgi:ribosome-associated translation inhibitor RaiA
MMRVRVTEQGAHGEQARAYAEFRLFTVLTRYGSRVRGAQIVISRPEHERHSTFSCRMTVALQPSGTLRTVARGAHAYAAIDRAVARVGERLRRLAPEHASP